MAGDRSPERKQSRRDHRGKTGPSKSDELARRAAASARVINLGGGLPTEAQFPCAHLAASFVRALKADDVIITNGAQQAIAIAVQLVTRAGDSIGVQPTSYPAALDLFRARKLTLAEGVSFDGGSAFHAHSVVHQATHLRLCFSFEEPARFREGVTRLARAWKRAQRRTSRK